LPRRFYTWGIKCPCLYIFDLISDHLSKDTLNSIICLNYYLNIPYDFHETENKNSYFCTYIIVGSMSSVARPTKIILENTCIFENLIFIYDFLRKSYGRPLDPPLATSLFTQKFTWALEPLPKAPISTPKIL
jgi:hypothetical protein